MRLNKILAVGCLILGFPAASFGETFNQDSLWGTKPAPQAAGAFERTVTSISKNEELANTRRLLNLANSKIAVEPNNDRYYSARAQCYRDLDQLSLALADIDKAINLNGRVGEYYSIRASIKGRLKDYVAEVKDLNVAISMGPASGPLYRRRAGALALLRRFDDSLIDADLAVKLEPNSAEAYAVRGTTRYFLHDYTGAVSDCTKAESIQPNNTLVLQLRSVLKTVSAPTDRH